MMLKQERQQRLLGYVNDRHRATVEELSDYLQVSKVTIRRDLDELDAEALIVKTFGGALSKGSLLSIEIPSSRKTSLCSAEKRRIGEACAAMIEDGDVVVLDSGTTTIEIAKRIMARQVIAVTNDLSVATALTARPDVTVLMAGGIVQPGVNVTTGHETERLFSELHATKTFLAADAWSVEHGITDRNYDLLPIKRAMLAAGARKILAVDHTKYGQRMFAQVCPLDLIDAIVSDSFDPAVQESLQAAGIEVIDAG